MFKQKWLYILFIVSVLLSSVNMLTRHEAEQKFHQVELAVPYYELVTANEGNDEALQQMITSGATSIVLRHSTIDELQQRGILQLLDDHISLVNPAKSKSEVETENSAHILVFEPMEPEELDYYSKWLESVFRETIEFRINPEGQTVAIINKTIKSLGNTPLGIDIRLAREIVDRYDVELVPSYTNDPIYLDSLFLEQQFQSLQELQVHHIYFSGNEALSYPSGLEKLADLLHTYDMHFTLIRSQLGAKELAKLANYELLRVIFIEPDRLSAITTTEAADLYELSVRERAVSMIYFPFPKDITSYPTQYIEQVNAAIQETTTRLAADYILTTAVPLTQQLEDNNRSLYTLVSFIAITMLALLLLRQFTANLWLNAIVVVLSACTVVLRFLIPSYAVLIESGYGLVGAITVPALAVMIGHKATERIRRQADGNNRHVLFHAVLLYVVTALITLGAVVIIVSLFNDISYLSYVEQFRGVKLLMIGPMMLIGLYLWRTGDVQALASYMYRIAVTERNWWKFILQITAIAIIGLVGVYLVLRSGTDGTTLPYEAEFRHWMDYVFGVRPRTKEMLIGHPLLLVALYSLLRYGKGRWLLLGAVIGHLSIINSFTHLHTPLAISITRTLWGLVLGLIIGILWIAIMNTVIKYTSKQ